MNDSLWKLVRVTLPGRTRPRLENVTLTIPAGVTAILGPSGAGKSSLLNLLVGEESGAKGTLLRCFQPPADRLPLFWSPPDDGLWPHLTVGRHLSTVTPRGEYRDQHLKKLLLAFDLADKSDARPDQLSQGERGRLAVARALAADPCVLVLDEPLTHVDQSRVWKYWDVIQAHRRKRGPAALVFSTHSPDVVIREAEHVICLDEGQVVYSGRVEQLYLSPPSAELGWNLGPLNWIDESDSALWLRNAATGCRGYRPEQLAVVPAIDSPFVVQQYRHCGAVAEVELLDERSGASRRFFHRPQSSGWRIGERVMLRLVALLLGCLLLMGCAESAAAPKLPVRGVTSWSMPAEGASVPAPRAVHATADGDVYVLDNAGRVLVFDDQGEIRRRWWMPDYSVGKPEKILRLRDGRLVVADTHYHRVVFFHDSGQVVQMYGSLGHDPGQFIYPVAVAEDDDQNLYVCEYGDNDRVQKFDREGNFLLAFGRQGIEPGEFQRPSGILWNEGKLYIADAFNNRLQVFSETGEFLEVLGGDEGALHYPYDLAMNAAGELYVVEYGAGRVTKLDRRGKVLGRFGSIGSQEDQFTTPWGMTVDARSRVFVADTGNRRIVRLD
ncbi:MAG: ATP-binding cassette domain-containing protein [Planctomycetales bacterium]